MASALLINPGKPKSGIASLLSQADLLFPLGMFIIVIVMVLPVPPFVLDLLLSANIAITLLIMMVIIYVKEPTEFSSFPTVLLAVTLLRLSLNIASTRLILLDGYAGQVIEAFGKILIQGNYLVGAVVFLILVIINFVVITKGAGRIAEVTARFTLDAMPGKQMAIDAELNAGMIDELTASKRRSDVQKEADFYGAMDGASKFVRGDAIAGILITLINIIGGFGIGMLQKGMSFADAIQKYTLLSIGDGLVTQIPALVVSVAAALLVTRTADENSLGNQISTQITGYPRAMLVVAGMLLFFAVMPGMPGVPFLILATIVGVVAWNLMKKSRKGRPGPAGLAPGEAAPALKDKSGKALPAGGSSKLQAAEEMRKLTSTEVLAVELGFGLIKFADRAQGGDLLDRITGVRRAFASETGMVIPPIAIHDCVDLESNQYRFLLRGKTVASGSIMPGRWLAMDVTGSQAELKGVPTKEPVFGLSAFWIGDEERREAELRGYSVVDAVSVVITHLSETLKQISGMVLSRQEVQNMVDGLKETHPALVAELFPDLVTLGVVQRILENLLREGIPIKNLAVILEAVADFAPVNKNPDELAEQVRRRLGIYFAPAYEAEPGILKAITLDPRLEQYLSARVQRTHFEVILSVDPSTAQYLLRELMERSNFLVEQGLQPLVITGAELRLAFKRFFEPSLPRLVVLSYQEIPPQSEIQTLGIIMAPPSAMEKIAEAPALTAA
ncbi:MAG: flagellar biosynthesis protein FlhA [Verrucomicrobiota bacterium]